MKGGETMVNMVNKELKTAMFANGTKYKQAAAKLEINTRTFTNKINKRTVNGYVASFTAAEKAMLANEFNLDPNVIE